jgi:hypothetical protein
LELTGRDRKAAFVELMRTVCVRLAAGIESGGYFILVVGDVTRGHSQTARTSRLTRGLFKTEPELSSFTLRASYRDAVPDIRRSRRECRGTKGETILIYQKPRRRSMIAMR